MNEEMSQNPELESVVQETEEGSSQKNSWLKELRDWVLAIAIAIVIAVIVRNYIFTLVKVQGQSMEPTLQTADRLYVNRLFYTPEKGDVIVFVTEEDPKHPYIKRVIATEGDSVYIDFFSGDVFVNGELIEEPYIKDKTMLTGRYIHELAAKGNYSPENPIVIEKGHLFAMGDNRNNSKDSRELGQISYEEVLGGAAFRFWPLNHFGSVREEATISNK